jgi:two-component system chemotaxis sensor kinase CheA
LTAPKSPTKSTAPLNKKKSASQPGSIKPAVGVEDPHVLSTEEPGLGPEKLSQVVEELALQTMIRGAGAFQKEVLSQLVNLGNHLQRTDVTREASAALALIASDSLTDDDARSIVTRLQSPASASHIEPTAENDKTVDTEESMVLAFDEDPELLADFVLEADEHLATIEEKILLLEKDPSLIDTIHAVFRSFHSIKGLAGFLGLKGVQAVAHEVETLLDHARNLRISINSEVVDLVLESSEYLKEEVSVVRAKLNNFPIPTVRDNTSLLQTLSKATADIAAGRPIFLSETAESEATITAEPTTIPQASVSPKELSSTQSPDKLQSTRPTPASVVSPPTLKPSNPPVNQQAAPEVERQGRSEAASSSIRVETSKLDRLMDMVGEMVIAQSILSNRTGSAGESRVTGEMSQLARITTEVQRCAMSMRMMPIGPLFQKNAKMVRDLSRRNGKSVSLELSGETTELDKTIAEELSDPLLHMIRNALDHGIEEPDERAAAGKTPTALLRIAAEHQAGQIVISISDDGRGLDPQKIRNKAEQKGLIESGVQMTEEEIFHLIFAPGFSTAEKITDISGRGVGMDVVRQHVESLRGRIEITSELGKGTTFRILLPLTLAIIDGLVIVVGVHRYIIPLFSVREMFRPTQDMLFTVQGSDEMILMRGSLLPLIRLHKRFAVTPKTDDICEGLLVVCEFTGKRFCLFVDDMLGRQEIVIKSLDEAFKSVKGLAGSAILGDGRIGLILDVAGIFHLSQANEEPESV